MLVSRDKSGPSAQLVCGRDSGRCIHPRVSRDGDQSLTISHTAVASFSDPIPHRDGQSVRTLGKFLKDALGGPQR